MRIMMMAGVSALALVTGPALAQNASEGLNAPASAFPCGDYDPQKSGLRSEDIRDAMDRDQRQASNRTSTKDGSVRDAMGDPPVQPSPSYEGNAQADHEQSFEDLAELLPVPDVADDDIEMRDGSGRGSDGDRTASTSDDFSDIIEEGEQVPDDISQFQDDPRWDRGAQKGQMSERAARRDLRDRNAVGRSQERSDSARATGEDAETDSAATDEQRMDRRRQLARLALRSAQYAVPGGRFTTYSFDVEDNERVIAIIGRDMRTGRRISVDVYPDGRIRSIDSFIPLDAVPDTVRSAVRQELGRFRVAHSVRSLRRDLDIYYEFAGYSESGRPVEVEIRADGRELSVDYVDRS